MNAAQIKTMLDQSKCPVAYSHFPGERKTPYLCFLLPDSTAYMADSRVQMLVHSVRVELYTDKKDTAVERKVERILSEHGLAFERHQEYLDGERLYLTAYEFETEETYGENNC